MKGREELVYGFHPVRELLRHRPHTVAGLTISARRGKRRGEIEALCRRHRIPVEEVPARHLDELVDASLHNGFLARHRPAAEASEAGGDADFRVLVEDVQDPRNLGALIRVCEGAGVGRLLIRDRGSAPLSAAAVKASAGAAEWLSIERITNSAREIESLKREGFWVYGTDPAGEAPWSIDLTGKILLCFGGEERGLRRRTRELCDHLVGLPMRGRIESLNVATAASALLFEGLRQRLTGAVEPSISTDR